MLVVGLNGSGSLAIAEVAKWQVLECPVVLVQAVAERGQKPM